MVECGTLTADSDATLQNLCGFARHIDSESTALIRVGGGQLWDEAYGNPAPQTCFSVTLYPLVCAPGDVSRYNAGAGTRHMIVGGAAGTVGAAGGWLQGGGLSGFTGARMFGFGVDSVALLEMVRFTL